MFVLLQGRESPGKGRWGWTQLRAGTNVEGEGKEEPLMEHEVDFWAGVALFGEGVDAVGFEFTQPNPLVMISLCSLFLEEKKRVCIKRKPKCLR